MSGAWRSWKASRVGVLLQESAYQVRYGNYAKALDATRRATEAAPDSANVWLRHASLLQSVYRYQDALDACNRALAIRPDAVSAWHTIVSIMLVKKQAHAARETALRALGMAPTYAPLWALNSAALSLMGLHDEADAAFDRAWQSCPDNVKHWVALGEACRTAKRFDRALLCYERALAINPAYERAVSRRVLALEGLGDYERALHEADEAVKSAPQSLSNRLLCPRVLYQMKRYQDALDALDVYRTYPEQYFPARVMRAVLLYQLKRYRNALDAAHQPLTHYEDLLPALTDIAGILIGLGRYGEALDYADRAIAREPRWEGAWTNKGGALFHLWRYEAALAALHQAQALADQLPSVIWMYIGRAHIRLGRLDHAQGALDAAMRADDREARTWVGRAELEIAHNQPRQALATLDHALTLDPELALIWRTRGDAMRALGNETGAAEAEAKANVLDAAQRA